jgi:hypothetical protein
MTPLLAELLQLFIPYPIAAVVGGVLGYWVGSGARRSLLIVAFAIWVVLLTYLAFILHSLAMLVVAFSTYSEIGTAWIVLTAIVHGVAILGVLTVSTVAVIAGRVARRAKLAATMEQGA